jgi:hypothetical protein
MTNVAKERAAMTTADLLDLFVRKASEPPAESSQILVRHLQCKESPKAAHCLTEALDRFARNEDHPLPAPAGFLVPPA